MKRVDKNENVFARPNGLRENSGTAFRVGVLGLPEGRTRYTSSRAEEEEVTQRCPHGNADYSRTHKLGECAVYEEERNLLEETRKIERV